MSRVTASYEKLRDLIVSRQLLPGASIIDVHIARRLGVSRTTVRIALHRLQQEGFIVASDLGTYSRLLVAPVDEADVRELARLIAELEAIAVERAALLERPDRKQLVRRLKQANRDLLLAGRGNVARDVFEQDRVFHRVCVDTAAGPRVRALYDVVKPQWDRYGMMYSASMVDRRAVGVSVREHTAIIGAIDRGNTAAARRAVRATWSAGAERLARFLTSLT